MTREEKLFADTMCDNLLEHWADPATIELFKVENITKPIALAIQRRANKRLNPHDRFCEFTYNSTTQVAKFDIVS